MDTPTPHLRPTAELAERVLLPGDPGRALLLAQTLLEAPRMFNHNRGLWGYTGTAADGEPLTVQATGMGGPSAAIVAWELAALGARTLIRVGTCGALSPALALGDLVVAEAALANDGASRALGALGAVSGDPQLTAALAAQEGCARGLIVTSDLFYEPDAATAAERSASWLAAGALAVEMEAAAVFRVAALRGLRAACVLAVTDIVGPPRARLDEQGLERAGRRLGRVAAAALGIEPAPART